MRWSLARAGSTCSIQPLALTGQVAVRLAADPMQALTIPDVVRLLAEQSAGVLTERDFTPLPCSHPTCFALTYLLRTVAEPVLRTVKAILRELNRLGPQASHRELLELGARNVKSIFIHQFMDRTSFDLSRAVKCCNHYPQPDGRLIPACVRNCI